MSDTKNPMTRPCPSCGAQISLRARGCRCGWKEHYDGPPGDARRCCECGGPWNIGKPAKHYEGGYRPAYDGSGWCWECWDKYKTPGGVHA